MPYSIPINVNNIDSDADASVSMPSAIAFTDDGEFVVGVDANTTDGNNTATTVVFDWLPLLGRHYMDPVVQGHIRRVPYRVIERHGMPSIEFRSRDRVLYRTLIELCSMLISALKSRAEAYLQRPVLLAVYAVPGHWNDQQRIALKTASEASLLPARRIFNDYMAASMALEIDQWPGEVQMLVVDVERLSFEISAVYVDSGVFESLAIDENPNVGELAFHQNVAEHLLPLLASQYGLAANCNNETLLGALRHQASLAMRRLLDSDTAPIELDWISAIDGRAVRVNESITRAQFVATNQELLNVVASSINKVLSTAGWTNQTDMSCVVLAGRATRIPGLKSSIASTLAAVKIIDELDVGGTNRMPEAVAFGAAILAATVAAESAEPPRLRCKKLLPLSIGFKGHDDRLVVLLPRNSFVPAKRSIEIQETYDHEGRIKIEFFEGEFSIASRNYKRHELELIGPPSTHTTIEVMAVIEPELQGCLIEDSLQLSARDLIHGEVEPQTRVCLLAADRLSYEEIEEMIKEAEEVSQ